MNVKNACKCLGINEKDIHSLSESQIKHKYHILALKFHPDKNKSLNATERFQEIQEAYSFICKEKQMTKSSIDYRSIFKQYLSYYINESDDILDLLYDIINKKMNTLLYNCSNSKLRKIYSFLNSQKVLLNIPNDILISIQKIIQEKTKLIEIECSFNDIWQQKIYILSISIDTLYIPLWHSKLEYNIEGINYIITCKCKDKNIVIDRDNNVHIKMNYIESKNNCFTIPVIGKRVISTSNIIKDTIVLKREGIPRIKQDNVYDNNDLSDIIITLLN